MNRFQAGFSRDESSARYLVDALSPLFLSNGKDPSSARRRRGGGGRETCTARFLAAMIGSGRQYLLNRWAVSRREYSPISPSLAFPPARRTEKKNRIADDRPRRSGLTIGPVSLRILLGALEEVRPLPSLARWVTETNYFARWRRPPLPVLAVGILPFSFLRGDLGDNMESSRSSVRSMGPEPHRSPFRSFCFPSFSFLRGLPWIPLSSVRWKSQSRSRDDSFTILSLRPATRGDLNYARGRWNLIDGIDVRQAVELISAGFPIYGVKPVESRMA